MTLIGLLNSSFRCNWDDSSPNILTRTIGELTIRVVVKEEGDFRVELESPSGQSFRRTSYMDEVPSLIRTSILDHALRQPCLTDYYAWVGPKVREHLLKNLEDQRGRLDRLEMEAGMAKGWITQIEATLSTLKDKS